MKSTFDKIMASIGKFAITILIAALYWMVLHVIYDLHQDPDKRFEYALWISDKILWVLELGITLVCGWGAYLIIAYMWAYNRK